MDPNFDGTLEMILEQELTRSPTLYPLAGLGLRSLAAQVEPGIGTIDEAASALIATRTGRPVVSVRGVVSFSAAYILSVTATDARTGAPLVCLTLASPDGATVASTVARLATAMRVGLGDPPGDLQPPPSVSTSIEADHEFVLASGTMPTGNFPDALRHMERAVELDPAFALAQAGMATALFNSGRRVEAQVHLTLALEHPDALPERTRLFLMAKRAHTGDDFPAAIAGYEELLSKWPADTRAANNLAVAYQSDGQIAKALALGRRTAAENHQDVLSRSNLVGYEIAAGNYEQAWREAESVSRDFSRPIPGVHTYGAAAAALLGHRSDVEESHRELQRLDPSLAALAIADYAMFEGRFADARATLEAGIKEDGASNGTVSATTKWAFLAEAHLRTLDLKAAKDAALHAATSTEFGTLYRAARVLILSGNDAEAAKAMATLAQGDGVRARVFAALLAGEQHRVHGRAKDAVESFLAARKIVDTWLVCEGLGRAYLDLGDFAAAETELTACEARRGEGVKTIADDTTLHNLPIVRYLLARAKDGLHREGVAEAYDAFLAMEPEAQGDALVLDARQRRGDLTRLGHPR
jgi:tetratricopeptide (TPR) repeat protein